MSTTPDRDPHHPDNWREFADERPPAPIYNPEAQRKDAPEVMGAYFAIPPWTLRLECVFRDPARAKAELALAPTEGVQYVARIYSAGLYAGAGLLWWEPLGTSPDGREPSPAAVELAMDLAHSHAAEALYEDHLDHCAKCVTESLRRAGLLSQEPQEQRQNPKQYDGPEIGD